MDVRAPFRVIKSWRLLGPWGQFRSKRMNLIRFSAGLPHSRSTSPATDRPATAFALLDLLAHRVIMLCFLPL